MGRIGTVLEFIRETVDANEIATVKVDPGGGAAFSPQHFDGTGVDAQPLPGDYAATADSPGAGGQHITGYADLKKRGVASPGERRLYCRDASTGEEVGEIWLKNDGTLSIDMKVAASVKAPVVNLDSPDVRISDEAGADIARVGDLVAVTTPPLTVLVAAPGETPVLPVPPTAVTGSGGIIAAGQIISGQNKAKA